MFTANGSTLSSGDIHFTIYRNKMYLRMIIKNYGLTAVWIKVKNIFKKKSIKFNYFSCTCQVEP